MIIGNFSRGFQRHCKVIIDFSSSVNYPVNDAMLMENIENQKRFTFYLHYYVAVSVFYTQEGAKGQCCSY